MRNVTRTIKVSVLEVGYMNLDAMQMKKFTVNIANLELIRDKDKREYIDSCVRAENTVESGFMYAAYKVIDSFGKRYGMPESLFMQYAKPMDDADDADDEN